MYKILSLVLLISMSQISVAANYELKIGDSSYEISLNEEIEISVGEKHIPIKLTQKEILTYTTDNFSFEHPRQYLPSKTDLGSGIFQTAMITPLGSAVMVQEYLNLDPTGIIDLMVNEITKEEREYGYKIESTETSVTLSDGKILNGQAVTSKYKGSDIKRFIYTYSTKDSGLLILTQVDYESEPNADIFITNIIDSLKITMK
ncbi:hypothetical protein [Microbulbifer sp. ZKSA002]|uniref:hypothetical protein n=1 Tax=Microbulbifer sp. ZKSA002 TaxID=3243388 RepID=UPI00403963B2